MNFGSIISNFVSSEVNSIVNTVVSDVEGVLNNILGAPLTSSADPKISTPFDYQLIEASLINTVVGNVDLTRFLIEANYYEDIYGDSISGNIVVSEAVGVLYYGSLSGMEQLKLSFASGFGGIKISNTFRVHSISGRHFDVSNNYETYVINFCSEELYLSEKYRISKSYKQQSISNIVYDVLKNTLGTSKNVDVDQTSGTYNFVLPNKKIFDTINWLSSYAMPINYSGADLLFYENNLGYHFKSLQNLFSKKPPAYEYNFDPKNVITGSDFSTFATEVFTILKLDILKGITPLDATTKGIFSNRVLTIDPIARKTNYNDFNYNEYFPFSESLNSLDVNTNNLITGEYIDKYGNTLASLPSTNGNMTPSNLQVFVSNANQQNLQSVKNAPGSVQNNFFLEKTVPYRNSQLLLVDYFRIRVIVPGNSNLSVGMILDINAFGMDYNSDNGSSQATPNNANRVEDSYLTGNYLVTSVRHVINPTRYITVLELCKDSNQEVSI